MKVSEAAQGGIDRLGRVPNRRLLKSRCSEWIVEDCLRSSMRRVEVKHVRRKDFNPKKRIVHIRTSKNETSKRVIP